MDKVFFDTALNETISEYERYKNDAVALGKYKQAGRIQNLIKIVKSQQEEIYDSIAYFFDTWDEIWSHEIVAISSKYTKYLGHTGNRYFKDFIYAFIVNTFRLGDKSIDGHKI